MIFEQPASERLKNTIIKYINEGILPNEYACIEELRKKLNLLGDEQEIENFSRSVRMNYLPVNDLYSLGYACEKLPKDFFTSTIASFFIAGGAKYFFGSSFLFTGGFSFSLLTLFFFSYRIHQKSSEGYDKIQRFNEIFRPDIPRQKNSIYPRLSPFSGR